MALLIIYIFIALVFSFLCSIAEAVLLSVTPSYISVLDKNGKKSGHTLKELKADINKPLAAILTLNTVAHTIGAAGAGAQAAVVFGNSYVGIASAVLTLLILIFSEIIPKTLGASYWKQLAPITAIAIKYLTLSLYPFVWMSEKITSGMVKESSLTGFSRDEFSAMAEMGAKEGKIADEESNILKNLLLLRDTNVETAMTPRPVIFSLSENLLVEEFFHKYDKITFSRILTYDKDKEDITGFVMRSDLLLAQARGNSKNKLKKYHRNIGALLNTSSLSHVFSEMMRKSEHIMLIVDEYGTLEGIITMEDVFETIIGLEIIDEHDKNMDMQALAKKKWLKKANKKGIKIGKQ
ncbi:MAG: HlyC/CorC family transporter [Gammaproteobacteria bacterium]|nr:MAG: HlyC/CorC family transporter [Gammaproteobacteria bacterium]